MTRMGRTFVGWLCCLSVLSACSVAATEVAVAPIEVIFDATQKVVTGGFRLEPPGSQWDGYGEEVEVYGDVLVVGAPDWIRPRDA